MGANVFLKNLIKFYSELYGMTITPTRKLIRLGATNDGGYLIPEDLGSVSYCFSPGVSDMADFELDCARIYGMKVFMCDHTVETMPLTHPNFHFLKKGIGYQSSMRDFAQPVSSWVGQSVKEEDAELLMQMDIEGAEYDFFLCEPSSFLCRFKYIIFEMHYLHVMLEEQNFNARLLPFLNKIKANFNIVHIHPNTSTVFAAIGNLKLTHCLEITLENKSLMISSSNKATDKIIRKYNKHNLDTPNLISNENIDLPDLDYLDLITKSL
jgi:hypothetical protein